MGRQCQGTRDRKGRKQDRNGRADSRARKGRKQDRKGRKQDRSGRKDSRARKGRQQHDRTRKKLRVLNVQRPCPPLVDG